VQRDDFGNSKILCRFLRRRWLASEEREGVVLSGIAT
jgi:hypothetical protein